ncbi:MAG: AAA domain-containing protein [Candidatus Glassbacteria bacterium]|nr:AAA domain-containing protein [Candidatus Glassbacteria bacterium]
MKTGIGITLLTNFAFLFVFHQSAYPEKYPFRNYSEDDGLPSPRVWTILQDRDGYLWFGTASGACKFDGINFTTYTTEDGLAGSVVFRTIEDSRGNLWFYCWGMGVSRFDGENWTTYTTEDGLAHNLVWSMLEDSEGNLWFGTLGGGASRFDGENWATYTTEDGLAHNTVNSILKDSEGNLWFATGGGVSRFDGEHWTTYTEHGLDGKAVNRILEDTEGNLWCASHGSGLCKFDGEKWVQVYGTGKLVYIWSMLEDKDGNIWLELTEKGEHKVVVITDGEPEITIEIKKVFSEEDGLPSFPTMIEDGQGNIWCAYSGGLCMYDGEKWRVYTTENGLPSNNINAVFEDREGNIWVGTYGGGVSRLSGLAFTTYTTADGLAGNSIAPVLEDAEGNIWFNDMNVRFTDMNVNGVTRYDGEKWTTYTTEDGLAGNLVYDMLQDSRGNLWFATADGLSRFDGEKWKTYGETNERGSYYDDVFLEDKQGNLWFGGRGTSVYKFDGQNWTEYGKNDELLLVGNVYTMIEDKKGNLWFGGLTGVTKFDGENWYTYITHKDMGLFAYLKWLMMVEDKKGNLWFNTPRNVNCFDGERWRTFTTEDGLAGNDVRTIYEDVSGHIWLGTNGGGISRFDGAGFTNYTTEDGLSSNVCEFIIAQDSYLYFCTPQGLNRFDGEMFKVYTANDGLAATAVRNPLKDSKGNLWFGSVNGVTKYNPSLDRPNTVPPPVYITRLRVLEKDMTVTSGLKLGPKQNNLRIDYVGISFTAPEHVIYNYKLEDLDEDWIKTTEHTMSYSYLPPGEYTFKVKARNRDGIWSEGQAELAFTILPPFWATLWFRGSILAAFLLALWGVHQARTRIMKKRNIELGGEITARKKVEEALRREHAEVERLKNRLQLENIYLREEIKIEHNFEEIISCSEALNNVLRKVEEVAVTDATVLILGETGTGKQLIARAIHNVSSRGDRPLVTVNCAALPASLIESELFGHEKGAFTGALSRRMGRFELADESSMFLDEIGELTLELQAKLLRVLQDGEFERLGSSSTIRVDVRIIAASNRDLEKAIGKGNFREDLYYRLNVYPIRIPPLREHKEDIPLLVQHFVGKFGAKTGKMLESVPQWIIDSLQAYQWPGNVRELENVIERAVIVSRGKQLELGDWLPKTAASPGDSSVLTLQENERALIIKALKMTDWRVSGDTGAAKILNINPRTLQSRMRKLGIKRER